MKTFTPHRGIEAILVIIFIVMAIGFIFAQPSEGGTYKEKIYNGVNPEIFDPHIVVYTTDAHGKIVSPDKSWEWHNSWLVRHRQLGVFGTARNDRGGYTLTNSFDSVAAEELTWAHYSFYLWEENIAEEYGCDINKIEKRIKRECKQSARVIRIDKLSPNLYVVMYVRSDHKKFELEEVDGYPPFNLGDNIGITNDGIITDIRVKGLDPYSAYPRQIFTYQRVKIPIKNVILLNPNFFQRPTELQTVFIHYDFFKKAFLYEHPRVAALYRQSGDPAIVEITKEGINIKFRRPVEYEVLE